MLDLLLNISGNTRLVWRLYLIMPQGEGSTSGASCRYNGSEFDDLFDFGSLKSLTYFASTRKSYQEKFKRLGIDVHVVS